MTATVYPDTRIKKSIYSIYIHINVCRYLNILLFQVGGSAPETVQILIKAMKNAEVSIKENTENLVDIYIILGRDVFDLACHAKR